MEMARAGETILVLDDEELVRRTILRMLSRLGYTLLQASTGPEALELLSAHSGPIHLLIIDVRLSVMSGPQLARQIATMRPDIRTLLISGGSNPDDENFLPKPFSAEVLASKVRQIIDGT
jgi:two-component system cell cycle sensor histidine kinase/response regulator CckA